MAQENEHLTTEQLSAFLDGEVSTEERTILGEHLKACQQCQQELASLRKTVALLRALPQPVLPRSFVLSAEAVEPVALPALASSHRATAPVKLAPRPRNTPLRIAFRTLSTIAAIIGIVFFLSGVLPTFSHSGAASNTTASSAAIPENPSGGQKQGVSTSGGSTSTGMTPAIVAKNTPEPAKHDSVSSNQSNSTDDSSQPPTSSGWPTILIFNLSTPEGRLGFGIILFILGVMGYVLFGRQRLRTP